MKRVFLTMPVRNQKDPAIELWAARNEYESFQIALQSDQEVSINKVETTDLIDVAKGEAFSAQNFSFSFPGYVYVGKNTSKTPFSELDGIAPGWFPDPLENVSALQFSGTRSLWGTCYVPQRTKPGDYNGKLVIHTSSGMMSVKVLLHVWNFSLPKRPSLYVTNWLHTSQIESRYKVKRGTDEYWNIMDKISQDMIAHRQSVIFTPLNLIKSTKAPDGSFSFDFSMYEKWVNIFLRNGFQVFEGSHLFHGGNSYNLRNPEGLSTKRIEFGEKDLSSPAGQIFLKTLLQALYQENLKLGIKEKYLQHIADEASLKKVSLYRDIAKLVRGAMSGVSIIDATTLPPDKRTGMMDIPVTLMGKPRSNLRTGVGSKWGSWWYTSVGTKGRFPNRFIDYPLIKMRIIPWVSWRADMSGYLHYAYNWWYTPSGRSPWQDVEQSGHYPPGDGFVVYPPNSATRTSTPVSSMRWENFRDGLEDYEYLNLLDSQIKINSHKNSLIKKGNPNCQGVQEQLLMLSKELRTAVSRPIEYPRSPKDLEKLRRRMGNVLDRLASCSGGDLP